MGLPPPSEPSRPPEPNERADLFIVEAGESRDRRCADCGKKTRRWKPFRRRGTSVVLCEDCAARESVVVPADGACPSCGAPLRSGDRFCGMCGGLIEHACSACSTAMGPDDLFCGKCGTRVA